MKTKTLGTIIVERRKELGLTQLELANKMGVTDKAVSKWERDLSCPDVHSLPHLAEVLGLSVEALMQSKAEPSSTQKRVGEIFQLVCKGIALAMGVSVVVLSLLDALEPDAMLPLLGLGLACLAVCALREPS